VLLQKEPPAFEWTQFDLSTNDEISCIIRKSPNKSCPLDPIPTLLKKACVEQLAPAICDIVNTSLQSGAFPLTYKKAIVTPLLKKANLDSEVLGNYCPVSGLCFASKVLEKVIAERLKHYLKQNGYYEKFQSAYR